MVDTSALVAIMRREVEQAEFIRILRDEVEPCISAATVAETLIVLAGRTGDDNSPEVMQLLGGLGARIVPVDRSQALLVE